MSKTFRTIGMIAGAAALIATGVGAVAGGAIIGTSVGAAGATAVTLGSVTSTIATFATIASGVASIGAQLTYNAKPPLARGSVTQVLISPDAPQPYVMGEGYFAGVLRHDCAYGADLKKVPNPYRWMVTVYSGGGPVEQIAPYVDQAAVTDWYTNYLLTDIQYGLCPEPEALVPPFPGAPGWNADSKLSGQAAIGWNLKFDKEGKRFASGMPQFGGFGKWVKAYDPRLDSTVPGGLGSHRAANEATWTWTENPALHAGTYALGRHQNGKRTFGIGLPATSIDWAALAAWANVCDANAWKIFGPIYEPMPETRWPNLKDICAAGAGRPIVAAGVLTFAYSAPRVAIDTFSEADLAGSEGSVTAMKSQFARPNTIVPKVRSPEHNWELAAAETPVTSSIYVTEDGEERKVEWPFNLVKDFDQGAQLAGYVLTDARELQPITLGFGVRVRAYKPGDCVHLHIPRLGLDTDAVIVAREYDHASMVTTFTFIGETPAKHDFALGRTTTAPPTPAIGLTGEERDKLSDASGKPYGWQLAIIRTASVKNPRSATNVARALLIGHDAGASASVLVARHDWDYPDGTDDITREPATVSGLAFGTTYYAYFDDAALTNTTPTYHATTDRAEALNSSDHPDRHPLGSVITPADGAADTAGGRGVGDGYGGDYPEWLLALLEDFNTGNNRNYDALPTPTIATDGTAVDHTTGGFGGVDKSFEWTWSGAPGDADGIEVALRSSTSNSAYTIGTTLAEEDHWVIPSDQLGVFARGQNPTSYDTWAVRYYRRVDPTPTYPAGLIVSAWAQPTRTEENPYRASASASFVGLIEGTTPTASVVVATDRANTAIKSDYTIANGMVVTPSIAANAVNNAGYITDTGTLALGASDMVEPIYLDASFTTVGGTLVEKLYLPVYLVVSNPTLNAVYSATLYLKVRHNTTLVEYFSDVITLEEMWNGASAVGDFNLAQRIISCEWKFSGLPDGTYRIGYRFATPATNAATLRKTRYIKGENMRAIK